jgi:peptide/nickel transport system substrate-binding protein
MAMPVFAAFSVAAIVAGCESSAEKGLGAPLRIGIEAAPTGLDPRFSADADSSRIAGLTHCSLVEADARGGFSPVLARAWRVEGGIDAASSTGAAGAPSSPGALGAPSKWTFELRDDARFHDGSRVTAADVVATYRSVLDPETASPKRAALASVTAVEADGATRVRFELSSPNAALLDAATVGILPARLAAGARIDDATRTVGCGPYRIERADAHSVLLVAADSWLGGTVTLPRILFRVVPDTVMRTLELEHGELDLVQNALEPDAVQHLAARNPGLRVVVGPYDAYQYLGINHRHAALRDVRVRRAIAHAIDR